jgi:3-hydroxyacyl-CoA dehydrogenase
VEVKIGVQHTPREIIFESAQSPADVEQAVSEALANPTGVLRLADEKGRRIIVSAAIIAYVEIAEAELRRVGFVAG